MDPQETTIGVVGNGVLGKAMIRGLVEHVKDVRVYDVVAERSTHSQLETAQTDIVFLCLPTPGDEHGVCDTSALDTWFKWYAGHWCSQYDPIIVIRSTVPVGYTVKAKNTFAGSGAIPAVLHMPEFLTARCSNVDFQCPARHVIGVPDQEVDSAEWKLKLLQARQSLVQFFELRFPGVPTIYMHSRASEITKLAMNGFFGLKVLYFNMIAALCDANGVHYDEVIFGMMTDGRIAHSHTTVPGPDGKFGFGGTCLPKDIANLAHCMDDVSLRNARDFLNGVLQQNQWIRDGEA